MATGEGEVETRPRFELGMCRARRTCKPVPWTAWLSRRKKWHASTESNREPSDLESGALPIELEACRSGAGRASRTRLRGLEGHCLNRSARPAKEVRTTVTGDSRAVSRSLACPGVSGCIRCAPRGYLVRGAACSGLFPPPTPHIGCDCRRCRYCFLALLVDGARPIRLMPGATGTWQTLVSAEGFEPSALCSQSRCATGLRQAERNPGGR